MATPLPSSTVAISATYTYSSSSHQPISVSLTTSPTFPAQPISWSNSHTEGVSHHSVIDVNYAMSDQRLLKNLKSSASSSNANLTIEEKDNGGCISLSFASALFSLVVIPFFFSITSSYETFCSESQVTKIFPSVKRDKSG